MKKLLLATAIAALSVSAAHAAPTVYGKALVTVDYSDFDDESSTKLSVIESFKSTFGTLFNHQFQFVAKGSNELGNDESQIELNSLENLIKSIYQALQM